MLPDYPKTKAKLWKGYMKVVEKSHQHHLGFLDGIKGSFMHEGQVDQLLREDEYITELTPKLVPLEGVHPGGFARHRNARHGRNHEGCAWSPSGLAEAKAKMIFEAIEEATRHAGTQVGPHSGSHQPDELDDRKEAN